MKRDKESKELVEEVKKKDKNQVHINIPNLAIRKGPGTEFDKTWEVIGNTDVAVKKILQGAGSAKGWGMIDTDKWINLDFTDYEE